jgi:hypothetical protein
MSPLNGRAPAAAGADAQDAAPVAAGTSASLGGGPPPEPPTTTEEGKGKLTPADLLKKYWVVLLILLGVLVLGGAYMYLKVKTAELTTNEEPVAAASSNIEQSIAAPKTEDVAPPAPTDVLDKQRSAAQLGTTHDKTTPDQLASQLQVVDTVGRAAKLKADRQQAARQRAIAMARARNVDTVEVTVRDPASGQYKAATVTVPRNSGGGNGGSGRRSGRQGNQASAPRKVSLPAVDTDGTPFETNPEVLAMLAASPPQTRATYEQMTGKRYRDPNATAASIVGLAGGEAAGGFSGADGFNTIKLRSKNAAGGSGGQDIEALTPDVFFKGVINGEQKVRTGSVVMLRLLEDAVVSGATFPKNMVFAGIASVETNHVSVKVVRLGPTRVAAEIYDFNYMPGIFIDPGKREPSPARASMASTMQSSTTQELTSAIDRSNSAANSLAGISARVGSSMIARLPQKGAKLREVLLPDGYPILITSAGAGQLSTGSGAGFPR